MLLTENHAQASKPIRQRTANLLQEAILKGHFRPGDEVPQLKLSRQLGLSQSSLREALQELEHRGLIQKHGRNWVITKLSEDDLSNLYEVRAVLEPLACRLAAQSFRQDLGARLDQCLDRMARAAGSQDYPEHSRADMEFHQLIWTHQPNRLLEKHLNILCLPLFAYDLVERSETAYIDFRRSLQRHRMILNLLRARDGERTERIMRRLIRQFHKQDILDIERIHEQTAGTAAAQP